MTLLRLLQIATECNASDLHLQDGSPPVLRVNGELKPIEMDVLEPDQVETLLLDGLPEEERVHVGDRDYQTSLDVEGVGRVRISLYRQNRSLAASLRLIPAVAPSLDRIGLPEGARKLCGITRGLVLVSGPSGTGKTTTLMAMLDHINQTRAVRIISIGDPVEFVLKPGKSIIILREVGVDTDTFATAVRCALRQDPDIIHVGEMRDLATVMMCLTAAEMGHLVMTNLHCLNATDAIRRLIDVFPAEQRQQVRYQLAQTLGGIIAQRLVPSVDGRGRIAAYEVLVNTPHIQQMIQDGAPDFTPTLETSNAEGMQSLDQSLAALVGAGTVEWEVAQGYATSPERLQLFMG